MTDKTSFRFLVPRGKSVKFVRRLQFLHAVWHIRDVADISYNASTLFAVLKFVLLGYTGFIKDDNEA